MRLKKNSNLLSLTKNQVKYFDRFLVANTAKTLDVLETMFSLNIDSSDSRFKILPTSDVVKTERLTSGSLFIISSKMTGEMQGSMRLLMRATDFNNLGEALKPTLKLLFLSSPDADLSVLDDQMPDWMEDVDQLCSDDDVFLEQLMDTSKEFANVLFGVYTSAIYRVFDLHTHHSLPEFSKATSQQSIQDIFSSRDPPDKQHLLIENNFSVLQNQFNLWLLISPSKKSLQVILNRVD